MNDIIGNVAIAAALIVFLELYYQMNFQSDSDNPD